MPYLKIRGTKTNNVDDTDKKELTLNISWMIPTFPKAGQDKKTITGNIRATRYREFVVEVKHVSMLIDTNDEEGDYSVYLSLLALIDKYEYIWFIETDLGRIVNKSGNKFWTTILPMKFELIQDSLSPSDQDAVDNLTTTWQSREKLDFNTYYSSLT